MAASSDVNTSGFAMPNAHLQIRLDIFHQDVRGLRTKNLSFMVVFLPPTIMLFV
jgi:hypothetical protein